MQRPDLQAADRLAFKLVAFTTLTVFLIWISYELRSLIVTVILALTLASALAPLADQGERKGLPRALTVILVYLGIAGMYTVLAATLVPALIEQGETLARNLPAYIDKLQNWYATALDMAGADVAKVTPGPGDLQSLGGKLLQRTFNASAGLLGMALNGLLLIFLSAYFVVEAKKIWPALLRWLPLDWQEPCAKLIDPLAGRMGGYVRGQALTAAAVAAYFAVAFSVLGLQFGLALAALAGLLNLVPYVGSFTAAALAFVVAFNQTPVTAALVVVAFAIEQWLESTILVPFLLGRQVDLHPLVVLLSMIAGATLLGVVGAIIAIPLVSAALYLADQFYLRPLQATESADPHS